MQESKLEQVFEETRGPLLLVAIVPFKGRATVSQYPKSLYSKLSKVMDVRLADVRMADIRVLDNRGIMGVADIQEITEQYLQSFNPYFVEKKLAKCKSLPKSIHFKF